MYLKGALETNEIHGLLWVENAFIFSCNKICSVHITSTWLMEVTVLTQNTSRLLDPNLGMDQSTNLTSRIIRTNQGPGKYEEYVKMKKKTQTHSKSEYSFRASSKWFSPR